MTARPLGVAVRELFALDVGATSPQTTMAFADHAIVIGTADGVSVIDPTKGRVVKRFAIGAVVGIAHDGAKTVAATADGAMVAILSDGAIRFRTALGAKPTAAPTLVDVDGDGALDAVVGTVDGKVTCIDARTGGRRWTRAVGGVPSGTSLVDVDGDGNDDVVVAVDRGALFGLRGRDGSLLFETKLAGSVTAAPTVVDVDGDGRHELVTTSTHGDLTVSSHDGTTRWTSHVENDDGSTVDVTASALPIASPRNGVFAVPTSGRDERDGMVLVGEGARAFRSHEGAITASPVVARIASEELPAAIVGTRTGELVAFDALGNRTVLTRASGPIVAPLLLSDVNAEGLLEIVAVTESGRLSVFATPAPAPAIVPRARGASPSNDGRIPPANLPWRFR
jgi:outer membrane protein assembly factor BamB